MDIYSGSRYHGLNSFLEAGASLHITNRVFNMLTRKPPDQTSKLQNIKQEMITSGRLEIYAGGFHVWRRTSLCPILNKIQCLSSCHKQITRILSEGNILFHSTLPVISHQAQLVKYLQHIARSIVLMKAIRLELREISDTPLTALLKIKLYRWCGIRLVYSTNRPRVLDEHRLIINLSILSDSFGIPKSKLITLLDACGLELSRFPTENLASISNQMSVDPDSTDVRIIRFAESYNSLVHHDQQEERPPMRTIQIKNIDPESPVLDQLLLLQNELTQLSYYYDNLDMALEDGDPTRLQSQSLTAIVKNIRHPKCRCDPCILEYLGVDILSNHYRNLNTVLLLIQPDMIAKHLAMHSQLFIRDVDMTSIRILIQHGETRYDCQPGFAIPSNSLHPLVVHRHMAKLWLSCPRSLWWILSTMNNEDESIVTWSTIPKL
jgi:hypothetical protein